MLYSINHTTKYTYESQVSLSQNRAALKPRSSIMQRCIEHELIIEPSPNELKSLTDSYGNHIHYFSIHSPMSELIVQSHSKVECYDRLIPETSMTPAWDTVNSSLKMYYTEEDFLANQFEYASSFVPIDNSFREYAMPCFPAGRPILEAVIDLTDHIFRDFEYDPLSTDIATPVAEVMKNRKGVCQDFAHLAIACLRSLGLPARYVSGYLRTIPPPGQERLQGADASHAWLSVYIPEAGWIDIDPTNNVLVSSDHITIGWGRDYDEVSPVKGTVFGGGQQTITVSVDVIPI